jgi:anti-anti-sigma regulatory factor
VKIFKEVTVVHLKVDLTQSGAIFNIITLLATSLQKIISSGYKKIRIDCKMIRKADTRGMNMLFTWMQSVRSMGVEPELINLTSSMQKAIQSTEFEHCFKRNNHLM